MTAQQKHFNVWSTYSYYNFRTCNCIIKNRDLNQYVSGKYIILLEQVAYVQ